VRLLDPDVEGVHEQVAVVVPAWDPQPLIVVPLSRKLTLPGSLIVAVMVTAVPTVAVVALPGRATEVVVVKSTLIVSLAEVELAKFVLVGVRMAVRTLDPPVEGVHEQVAVEVPAWDPQLVMVVPLSRKLTLPAWLIVAVMVTAVPTVAV